MTTINKILNKSSIFGALDKEDIQKLEPFFDTWNIQPEDIPARAGDTAQFFFLLHDGIVLLAMEDGKSIVLNTPGDFIGLQLLTEKDQYKTTIITLERGHISVISRQDFINIIKENSLAASLVLSAWQEYLEKTAPFIKTNKDTDLLEYF